MSRKQSNTESLIELAIPFCWNEPEAAEFRKKSKKTVRGNDHVYCKTLVREGGTIKLRNPKVLDLELDPDSLRWVQSMERQLGEGIIFYPHKANVFLNDDNSGQIKITWRVAKPMCDGCKKKVAKPPKQSKPKGNENAVAD